MKVLIVDDNNSNIENRKKIFKFPKATKFYTSLTRDDATDLLKEHNFDVIFLDLALVQNDPDPGFFVLDAIYDKASRFGKHGAVFVISRFADPDILKGNRDIANRLSRYPIAVIAEPIEPNSNLPYDLGKERPESYNDIQAIIDLIGGAIKRNCQNSFKFYFDAGKVLFIVAVWVACIVYLTPLVNSYFPKLGELFNVLITSIPAALLFVVFFFDIVKSLMDTAK